MKIARMVTITVAGGILAVTLGGCGSSKADAGRAPSPAAQAVASTTYTTPDGTPQLDQIAKEECGILFQEAAGAYPPLTVPAPTQYEGTRYQGLYQATRIWNSNPGASFNEQYVQAACTKLGLWPQP